MSTSRNDLRLRRQAGSKRPRSVTLIVCEGETEAIYIKTLAHHLGLSSAEVIVADNKGSAPISVVDLAIGKYGNGSTYDHVFCVFDRDGHESYQRATEKAQAAALRKRKPVPIKVIRSVPCFEFWVLLHHLRTSAPFANCDAVIRKIKEEKQDYSKADLVTSRNLMDDLETATANSLWLEQQGQIIGQNPSTNMHELVEHLGRMAEEKMER